MKQLIIISALIFTGASLSAQTNMRASKMDVVAEKNEGSKAKEDVLYGKTVEGQDKGLVFRQSVLDETNTKAEEKREMMATEEKLKLLNNNKTATKTQNKPN